VSAGSTTIFRDGAAIATVRASRWRERAGVLIDDGQAWTLAADGRARVATRPDQPGRRFIASRPSVLRSGWELECDGVRYALSPMRMFSATGDVLRDGHLLGTNGRNGFWTARPVLELSSPIPAEHGVFLVWIAYLMRKRQRDAAFAPS
jgi:hypothetical protein